MNTSGPSQYVPNTNPLSVPFNLRPVDPNTGLPVTQMYLVDFSTLIGGYVNTQFSQIASINTIVTAYASTLSSLQTQINAIVTSGSTHIPSVNGGCLNGSVVIPVDTATTLLITNTCSYNTILGTPTALAQAVLTQPSGLNLLPAFSQSGSMSGLAGWVSAPTTLADSEKNQWISYGDARAGITKALAAITPTCAQVLVNYAVSLPTSGTTFNFYFNGYTFIPTGYTDNGSSIQITDGMGGVLLYPFNIVTWSTSSVPLVLTTSGSTLSSQALLYNIVVTSNVINSSLGTTCIKGVPVIVAMSSSATSSASGTGTTTATTSPNMCCPDIGTYTGTYISGTTTIPVVTGLTYTPRFVSIISADAITGSNFNARQLYNTLILGGAILNISTSSYSGPINFNWIAYR